MIIWFHLPMPKHSWSCWESPGLSWQQVIWVCLYFKSSLHESAFFILKVSSLQWKGFLLLFELSECGWRDIAQLQQCLSWLFVSMSHRHEHCQKQTFPSRTLNYNEVINVIYFLSSTLMLWLIYIWAGFLKVKYWWVFSFSLYLLKTFNVTANELLRTHFQLIHTR